MHCAPRGVECFIPNANSGYTWPCLPVIKEPLLAQQLRLLHIQPHALHQQRPRDVRAASSSVPWRNAQPTKPINPKAPLETPPLITQQHKLTDLVGYTAILSKKARDSGGHKTLGIVNKVRIMAVVVNIFNILWSFFLVRRCSQGVT